MASLASRSFVTCASVSMIGIPIYLQLDLHVSHAIYVGSPYTVCIITCKGIYAIDHNCVVPANFDKVNTKEMIFHLVTGKIQKRP